MNKFFGKVGFFVTEEKRPGVWIESIVEKEYYGEILKNSRYNKESNQLNDDINISNEISIISDTFINNNFSNIRYVEFNGTKWKVSNINIQYPRLILSVGGVYNG